METDPEYLYPNSQVLPVLFRGDVFLRVGAEEDLEGLQPVREHSSGGLLDGLRVLILDHVERFHALGEHRDSACTSRGGVSLKARSDEDDREYACSPTVLSARMLSRTGRSSRNTGSIWSSVKSDLMNSAKTCMAP